MNKNRISLLTAIVATVLAVQPPFVAYAILTDNLPTCTAGQTSGCKPDTSIEDAERTKLERQNATTNPDKDATDLGGAPNATGKSSLMGAGFKFDPNSISPTSNPKGYRAGSGNIQPFLERIAQILLIVVSTGAVLSIVIGGFYMATSGGDTEKANKGKIIISYNIIAIVVALLSYAIIQFVIWLI